MKITLAILAAVALLVDIFAVSMAISTHLAKDGDSLDDIIQVQKAHNQKLLELDDIISNLKLDVIVLQKLRGYNHD